MNDGMAESTTIGQTEIRIPYRDIDASGAMHASAYISHAETPIRAFWRYRPVIDDEPLFSVRKFECVCHRVPRADEAVQFFAGGGKNGGRPRGFWGGAGIGQEQLSGIESTRNAPHPATPEPTAPPGGDRGRPQPVLTQHF